MQLQLTMKQHFLMTIITVYSSLFKIIHLKQIYQVHTIALLYCPIWMPVGYQGHFRYAKFEPILVHLTHVVTCVGSNNLIYALTVVIIFRSILLPKILSQTWVSTFKISCFGPIWPKVCHSCHITTCPPPLESHLRPCSKLVLETCWFIGLRPSFYPCVHLTIGLIALVYFSA